MMGDANKIVVPHYPVEKLPEDLRQGIAGGRMVRVTVEAEAPQSPEPRPLHEMYGFAAGHYASHGMDPVDAIRQMRDEWDS